jgi:hypothetical protein
MNSTVPSPRPTFGGPARDGRGGLRRAIVVVLASLTPLLFTGCGETHAAIDHASPDPATTYKEGYGLQISAAARAFIGLETGEVVARDFPEAPGAAAIPAEAVLVTARGDFVFVTNGEWLLRTPVELGATSEGWREVRGGLYEGDTIVTRGAHDLWLAEIQAVNGGVSCAHGH